MRMSDSKRLSAVILALALVLTLLPTVAFGANINVIIEQSDTEAEIAGKIDNAVLAAPEGGTVTVTGSKTNVTQTIYLSLYDTITIIWKAIYHGSAAKGGLIELYGSGVFEVAEGADIKSTGDSTPIVSPVAVAIVISGGTVEGSGSAVSADTKSGIRMTGGTVLATGGEGGIALYSWGGDITISGTALVRATGEGGDAIHCYDGNLTISGGTVETTGDYAHTLHAVLIEITGGTVRATGDFSIVSYCRTAMTGGAIEVTGRESIGLSNDAVIMGGTVTATGEGSYALYSVDSFMAYLAGARIGDFGFDTDSGPGLIVEVDSLRIPLARHGTSEGLTVMPGSFGTVTWVCTGDSPLIHYEDEGWSIDGTIEWGEYFDAPLPVRFGDANEDGLINASDAAAILRHLVRLTELTPQGKINAKVTGGANISASDAAFILRYLVRLEAELDPNKR